MSNNFTLPYKIHGNTSSKTLIVFMHGYPNTMKLWFEYVEKYKNDYMLLNISYPNFVTKDIKLDNEELQCNNNYNYSKTNKNNYNIDNVSYSDISKSNWGISIEETVTRLKITLDSINLDDNLKPKRKVMLITHDWGSYFGYLFDYKNPNYITDFISLDVSYNIDLYSLNLIYILFYQLLLSFFFLLGKPIGDFLCYIFLRFIVRLNILEAEVKKANCCYFYYYLHKNVVNHFCLIILINILYFTILNKFLGGYIPLIIVCVLLLTNAFLSSIKLAASRFKHYKGPKRHAFIYSKNKLIMFHSKEWLNFIQQNKENEVIAVKGNHWVSLYAQDVVIDCINKRLKKYFN